MLADTHCHLDFDRFDEDRAAVVDRALKAGIERILNPGIEMRSSRAAVALSQQFDCVFSAIGIHPNEAGTWDEQSLPDLGRLAQSPKVVAIGEIGLDYYWESASHDLQTRVLQAQLDLARDLALPVIIHVRDQDEVHRPALRDAISVLAEWTRDLKSRNLPLALRPGVLHSFSGDLAAAEQAVGSGFCLGISGPVTFKKAALLHSIVREIPLENLLTETDSPFLTPEPHRGRRNEPGHVRLVADRIAHLRGEEAGHIDQVTSANSERLFHW